MPWLPEVFTAPMVEARRAREAALVNDAVAYYEGIMAGEPEALVRSFAAWATWKAKGGYEPSSKGRPDWLRERDAVVENVALMRPPTRTVAGVVLRLLADDGGRVELPAAVVSECDPDRTLEAIRVYHGMWPLTDEHRVRPPLLPADPGLHAEGTPGDYQRALDGGDTTGIVAIFEPEGYARAASRAEGRTSTVAWGVYGSCARTCSPPGRHTA